MRSAVSSETASSGSAAPSGTRRRKRPPWSAAFPTSSWHGTRRCTSGCAPGSPRAERDCRLHSVPALAAGRHLARSLTRRAWRGLGALRSDPEGARTHPRSTEVLHRDLNLVEALLEEILEIDRACRGDSPPAARAVIVSIGGDLAIGTGHLDVKHVVDKD